jgi:hypothetical protein
MYRFTDPQEGERIRLATIANGETPCGYTPNGHRAWRCVLPLGHDDDDTGEKVAQDLLSGQRRIDPSIVHLLA